MPSASLHFRPTFHPTSYSVSVGSATRPYARPRSTAMSAAERNARLPRACGAVILDAPVELVWLILFLGTGTGLVEWVRRRS